MNATQNAPSFVVPCAPHAAFPEAGRPEAALRRRAVIVTVLSWLPVLAGAIVVGVKFGPIWPLLILGLQVLVLAGTVLATFRGARRLLRRNELHPITSRTQPELHALASDVAQRLGIPLPPCYVLENPEVNAFATLAGPRRPVVVLHTGLLARATAAELRGVLAHELSHIVNRDLLVQAVARGSGQMLSGVSRGVATAVKSNRPSWKEPSYGDALLAVPVFILGRLVPGVFHLMLLGLSRSRESLADLTAARALGGADPMLAALRMLGTASAESRRGYAAKADSQSEHASTHPPIRRRIAFLLDCCRSQISILPPSQ